MRKLSFSIVTTLLFISCSNNSLNEKRVIEIVDSVINSKSNSQTTEIPKKNLTSVDQFLGSWANNSENSNGETITINEGNSMKIAIGVSEMSLKYELVESELLLKYDGTFAKFQFEDQNKIGQNVGRCFIKNNKLIVEFTSLNDSRTGFTNGTYKMVKVD